jgi:hypothetical protein
MRMRKLMAVLTLAATLLLLPRAAEAQAPRRNRGLDITLGIGAAGCTDVYCDFLDMSAETRLQVLFRVVRYFAVGAHVGFQFLQPDRNAPARYDLGWAMFLGPEVRGILPVGRLEAWLGFTAGYMRVQIEQPNNANNEVDVEWASLFGLGFGFGAQYFVHRIIAIGLDFWLYKGFYGRHCTYQDETTDEHCWDPDRYERAALGVVFTVGANITFFIPL